MDNIETKTEYDVDEDFRFFSGQRQPAPDPETENTDPPHDVYVVESEVSE